MSPLRAHFFMNAYILQTYRPYGAIVAAMYVILFTFSPPHLFSPSPFLPLNLIPPSYLL